MFEKKGKFIRVRTKQISLNNEAMGERRYLFYLYPLLSNEQSPFCFRERR
jgi:hypothetical protein